jgi:hypothetical protein
MCLTAAPRAGYDRAVTGVAALLAAVLVAAAPADDEAARRAAREVFAGDEYQTTLPGDAGTGAPVEGRRVERPERGERQRGGDGVPSSLGAFAQVAMWVVIGVTLAVVVVALGRGWKERPRAASVATARAPAPPPTAPVAAALDEAEALAREGRFAEAVHVLLLRTLRALSDAQAVPIPGSYTSREILARVSVPAPARDALAGLVGAVEASRFGDAGLAASDWEHALERHRRFREAVAGRAA